MPKDHQNRNSFDEKGDQFLALFQSSERELFRYIVALVPNLTEAEEIMQQTAMALWTKMDHFDATQSFTPWACRFALNTVKQWAASRQRWKHLALDGLAEQLVNRRSELARRFEDQQRHVESCLQKLPDPQRELIESYYWKRQRVETIAEKSGKSIASIYKLLQRTRALLRECIEKASNSRKGSP